MQAMQAMHTIHATATASSLSRFVAPPPQSCLIGHTTYFHRIIFAIILPPVGVFLQVGLGLQFWINVVLTLLGYIPGIIHAIWIIATR